MMLATLCVKVQAQAISHCTCERELQPCFELSRATCHKPIIVKVLIYTQWTLLPGSTNTGPVSQLQNITRAALH